MVILFLAKEVIKALIRAIEDEEDSKFEIVGSAFVILAKAYSKV